MANTKRHIKLTVRVDQVEHEIIKRIARLHNLSIQDYMLQSAINANVISKTVPTEIKSIYIELKKQGINLNQLAKRANESGMVDYKGLDITREELTKVWQQLRQFLPKNSLV